MGADSNTILLLHCNGSNNSTSIPDTSPSPRTVTAAGTAKLTTTSPKFGTASILFDGSGSVTLDNAAAFSFGSGDFTIEGELWITTLPGVLAIIYDARPSGTNGHYPTIYVDSSGHLVFFENGVAHIVGTTTMTTGTWYYWVLQRSGTTTTLWVDGVSQGTYSDTNSYSNGASRPIFGASGLNGTLPLTGKLDEIRVSGIARYTGNPPVITAEFFSSLVADAGSYALTGVAAGAKFSFVSAAGSYTMSGIDARLGKGYSMVAAVGNFITTGVASFMLRSKIRQRLYRSTPSLTQIRVRPPLLED